MLCTKCSEVVKPVVALDIDGTMGDYHRHLIEFAVNYLGHGFSGTIDLYRGAEPFRDWFGRAFDVDLRTFRDIKLAYRQGAQKRSMPCFAGAPELARGIRMAGGEVWVTTTRPYLRHDGIDPDTRAWLSRHRIPYDGLLYDQDKYTMLADRLDPKRVVMVLDDLPENLEAAAKVFGDEVPVQRRQQYNRDSGWDDWHVDHLEHALEIALDRMEKWHGKHA